jgi:hypothetical protein
MSVAEHFQLGHFPGSPQAQTDNSFRVERLFERDDARCSPTATSGELDGITYQTLRHHLSDGNRTAN